MKNDELEKGQETERTQASGPDRSPDEEAEELVTTMNGGLNDNRKPVGPNGSMFENRWWRLILLLSILAIVVALIWILIRFIAPGPEPVPAVACRTVNPRIAITDGGSLTRTKYLVKGEVIVFGPKAATTAVISEVVAQNTVTLGLVRECDIRNLGQTLGARRQEPLDGDRGYLPFTSEEEDELALNLYQVVASSLPLTDDLLVGAVLNQINEAGMDRRVFADANYLTGMLGQSQCSNPYEPVGSPYEPVGSPYEPVGSPIGGSAEAVRDMFWQQWAFEHVGVGPSLRDVVTETHVIPGGGEVRVGVFDTSPFTLTLEQDDEHRAGVHLAQAVSAGDTITNLATINWVTPTLEMLVAHPAMPVFTPTATNPVTVSDHGLFVAGLVHAVAPESDIQLIRVLNEYGCGDLYTLNEALYRFITQAITDSETLDGVVLNLSLGVHQPTIEDVYQAAGSELTPTIESGATLTEAIDVGAVPLVTDTIESLRAVVALAYREGMVVVAAAGNGSHSGEVLLPPDIPARYPFVMGVAASNLYRERSCFSNWGDVYAPGGDAITSTLGSRACKIRTNQTDGDDENGVSEVDSDDAIISLAWSSSTDYAYWKGTSFATPLVSGLASLVLDAGVPGFGSEIPRRVFDAVRCGAPRGDGVINAPATLLRCLP